MSLSSRLPGNTPGQVKVLIIDDERVSRTIATLLLRRAGCWVEEANTGSAGVERALAGSFDVVLLDFCLPDMSGGAVANMIRSRVGESIPRIIAYTAYGLGREWEDFEAYGFDDLILKPADRESLYSILNLRARA